MRDPSPTPSFGQHPDDAAVDLFAAALKAKLATQREKGWSGWQDPQQCSTGRLQAMLVEQIGKGDPVDVGNLAMMLWSRGQTTAPANGKAAGDQADTARLNWLNDNFSAREKNSWDAQNYQDFHQWVFFAPNDVQGNVRSVIDRAMTKDR